jgi:glycosyltransferase involved in cell wall biosynthesis
MPAYNAGQYIAETIASVQAQDMPDWELVITDDGSTDNTAEVVETLAAADPRIRLFRQQNGRQGKARNLALSHTNAPWIAFLDADDLWHPEKLRKQFEVTAAHPDAELVFTAGISFDSDSGVMKETHAARSGMLDPDEMYLEILRGYSLPVLSVLVQRSWIEKVGGFGEELPVQNAEDYQLWLKMADAGIRMYGLNEELFRYRIHTAQTTFQDGVNLPNVLWALALAKLERIASQDKMRLMEQRLNRYLVHHIEELNGERLDKVLDLYRAPLCQRGLYFHVKLRLLAGKQHFKKWAYRHLQLKLDVPPIAQINSTDAGK